MTSEPICPVIYYKEQTSHITVGNRDGFQHYFGGENDFLLKGQRFGPRKLHKVLSFDLSDPLLSNCFSIKLDRLNLLYGFCYDNCELEYKTRTSDGVVMEVLSIIPNESEDDWPYDEYPLYFEKKDISLSQPECCSYDEFLDFISQDFDENYADKLIVAVPPSEKYGVSLWGEMGDEEGVQVIFIVDTNVGAIKAFNVCT